MNFLEAADEIRAGRCPHCAEPFLPRDGWGWCSPCRLEWRVRTPTPAETWAGPLIIDNRVEIRA